MIELNRANAKIVCDLFKDGNNTMILPFVQGHMGRGWVDRLIAPTCGQVIVGDFCYIVGNYRSSEAKNLVGNIPSDSKSQSLYIIPQNKEWGSIIEEYYQDRCHLFKRYAIKIGYDHFDTKKLEDFADKLPTEYHIERIDQSRYQQCLQQEFSVDLCSLFASAEDYVSRGLGFCVVYEDQIVCGASSYTIYDGGIEIEIDTAKEHRRKGLATACAARLILECLATNKEPNWDAANKWSVGLAEKLGYYFDYEYDTYEIKR